MSTPLANKTTISSRNKAAAMAGTTRIPQSRLSGTTALNSRSSSVLSAMSSATTKKPMLPPVRRLPPQTVGPKRPPLVASEKRNIPQTIAKPTVPETVMVRKGLAKFSNPIECQRQIQALNLKISQLNETVETRDREVGKLQDRLKKSIEVGVGYAATVQYFSSKLKLDSKPNLLEECEYLKSQVADLTDKQTNFESRLKITLDDYQIQCQAEQEEKVQQALTAAHQEHSKIILDLNSKHSDELDDLNKTHSLAKEQLRERIESLQTELALKSKEMVELRREHETLNNSYSKLEETLTKDKDARVKYAQEKINQLQKDVESLNSVLEMKSERIHALERDSLLLSEVQNELITLKDLNKALDQQMESIKAALEKKREQCEKLIVEKEAIQQELKRERLERRRMTQRTEQLEFVLNESCGAESTMFDSTIRDLDSADHLV